MALFELARGLAAGYNGFNEGADAEKNRQQADADRKYEAEQRVYKQEIQDRARAENARADKLRSDLSSIDPAMPKEQAYGIAAKAYGAAGDFEKSWAAQESSIKAAYGESAKGYQRLVAASRSMDAKSVADAVVSQLNSDYLPTKVIGYSVDPADGSIDMEVEIRNGGQRAKHKFKNKEELLHGMESIYSPDTYNAFIKTQREIALKAQEKAMEPRIVGPGAALVAGGKPVYQNNVGHIPDPDGRLNADGTIAMIRAPGGRASSGTGAGAGAGGKPVDAIKPYVEAFEFVSTKGEGKLTEDSLARGQSYLPKLAEQGINPQVAARIARDAAVDPTKTSLQIDYKTGRIDRVYSDKDVTGGRGVTIAESAGEPKDLLNQPNVTKEAVAQDVQRMAATMIASVPEQSRPAAMQQLLVVAHDKQQREAYLIAAAGAGKDVDSIRRQLDLVAEYTNPPQSVKPGSSGGILDRLRSGLGLSSGGAQASAPASAPAQAEDPNSPAAKVQARQKELRAQNEEKERQRAAQKAERERAVAEEYRKDAQSMDPLELAQKWDSRRRELSSKDAADLQNRERQIR